MEKSENIINQFPAITLKEVNKVGLMDRVDKKFYFHERLLPNILMSILKDYSVLEIKGKRLMPYESFYYDTPGFQMFKWHHSGKLNRFKVRRRTYTLTGDTFLEVKFKSNKGKTIKSRQKCKNVESENKSFIANKTPFDWADLKPVMNNQFDRIMLVNHNLKERVTIDLNLGFSNGDENYSFLDKLVILELKSERQGGIPELQKTLKSLRIYPSSFSKFITGISMHHNELKKNRFKSRFLDVNKVLESKVL